MKSWMKLALFLAFLVALLGPPELLAQESGDADVPVEVEEPDAEELTAEEPGGEKPVDDEVVEDEPVEDDVAEDVPGDVDLGGVDPSDGLSGDEIADSVGIIKALFESGQYAMGAGFLILILVFVLRKIGLEEKVNSNALPWVTLGLSTLSAVGVALAGGADVGDGIYQGLLSAFVAMGGWDLLSSLWKSQEDAAQDAEG